MSRQELSKSLAHLEVFELRRDGYSEHEIADKVRLPPIRVKAILADAFDSLNVASTKVLHEARALDLARLEAATKALMPKVVTGDINAINTMLKVMQRRAALIGLDAPREVVTKNFNIGVDDDIANMTTTQLKAKVLELARAGQVGVTTEGEFYVINPEQS